MKIERLKLYSANPEVQKTFYTELLGLPLAEQNTDSFTIQMGSSFLTFERGEQKSYYHFAINIPSDAIQQAKTWIQERTEILPFRGEEIVDFSNWNAKSLYFYDQDKNIVEFIARRNLKITSQKPFSSSSLLHLSEIGLPVSDVRSTYEELRTSLGIEKYDGDFRQFCAIGRETGLFIVIDYNQKDWIPNMDEAIPFPLEAIVINDKGNRFHLKFEEGLLKKV